MQATSSSQSDTLEPFDAPVNKPRNSATVAEKTEISIAVIGGGSRSWAVMLMRDLALSGNLKGEIRLFDIDHPAAKHNEELAAHVFSHPDSKTKFAVRATDTLAAALRGADFVIVSIEPGPTTMRHADLEIPAKYGILQTVGDSTGPGGIMRAMRSVPLFTSIAQSVMEFCPNAWVINYTNPMTLCTAALFAEAPKIKAFGCCHEVFGTQRLLAKKVSEWFSIDLPDRTEIELDITGVNHFTWATKASWKGHDLFPFIQGAIAKEGFFADRTADSKTAVAEGKWFGSPKIVAYDLFRRFGALGAAGDRHLVEFVPWYLSSEAELHRWGVVATPYSWRVERSVGARKSAADITGAPLEPSGEEGVQQIEALLGISPFITNVNVPNQGQIPWLPPGTIVETYAEFARDRVRPIVAGPLAPAAQSLVRRVSDVQSATLQACQNRSLDLAFQAMLCDPLVNISTDAAAKMFQEMVDWTKEMLPGWR